MKCSNGESYKGYAYLQYTVHSNLCKKFKLVNVYNQGRRCDEKTCTAINCPFKHYPFHNITCELVNNLQLLHETPNDEMPSKDEHESSAPKENMCMLDDSTFPYNAGPIKSIRINEQNLDSILNFNKTKFTPVFNVTTNKRYRFRVIGAMFLHAFRLSIDGHKLNILATDGYS